MTANRTPDRRPTSSIRCTSACSLDFSTSSSVDDRNDPTREPDRADAGEQSGGQHHERRHFRRAVDVVTAARDVGGGDDRGGPGEQDGRRCGDAGVQSHPLNPPTAPSIVNVRMPAKRAAGPSACPDHWRSRPTAAPPSVAIKSPTMSDVIEPSRKETGNCSPMWTTTRSRGNVAGERMPSQRFSGPPAGGRRPAIVHLRAPELDRVGSSSGLLSGFQNSIAELRLNVGVADDLIGNHAVTVYSPAGKTR